MPVIHVLSPHVADLIAAGEVVERPASAVKELLENAVDAGARTVVLELRAGGRDYIRVTDDGVGMAPEDAGVCFLRHATSKLSDERGLEAIGTLGFRGEALAAISAVSRITLTTRRRGAAMGVRVEAEAGEIVSMEETGCPEGTTITVRDLFYNTPARQKFLGTDRSEGAACVQSALRTALGRPDVSFRCLRDQAGILRLCVIRMAGRVELTDLKIGVVPCLFLFRNQAVQSGNLCQILRLLDGLARRGGCLFADCIPKCHNWFLLLLNKIENPRFSLFAVYHEIVTNSTESEKFT